MGGGGFQFKKPSVGRGMDTSWNNTINILPFVEHFYMAMF